MRDRRAQIGLVIVALIIGAAVFAPLLVLHDPIGIDLAGMLEGPSADHWMGTDIQGRDVWARLVYGARVSIAVGVISQGIALFLGVLLGLVAGYYGGWIDELVMRLADVTLAFPTLLLLIAMVAALQPSMIVVFATIGVVGWAGMARLVRGQVLVVRQLEYVQAIRALGAKDRTIIAKHVLPNVIAPVVIAATLGVAGAIMAEAALSFLATRPGRRSFPESRSAHRCSASTCSAMLCVTRSTRDTSRTRCRMRPRCPKKPICRTRQRWRRPPRLNRGHYHEECRHEDRRDDAGPELLGQRRARRSSGYYAKRGSRAAADRERAQLAGASRVPAER